MRIFFRPPRETDLKALLADPTDSAAKKRLTSLARQGRLPGIEFTSELWTERETIARYSGKQPAADREELWWKNAGFRRDMYQWIEQQHAEKAIPLLIRGLSDPDQSARESAVKALASMKRIETTRYLALALDDDEPVSGVAAGALRSIGASM
jgi:HEAT repeat protein